MKNFSYNFLYMSRFLEMPLVNFCDIYDTHHTNVFIADENNNPTKLLLRGTPLIQLQNIIHEKFIR